MARQFNGFGGGNMQHMMKQAKKMQADLLKQQEDLKASEFEGTAASGLVTVKINGANEVKSIKLSRDIVDPNDIELLEDSIVVAINDAVKKCNEASEKNLSGIAGGLSGLNIPGLF